MTASISDQNEAISFGCPAFQKERRFDAYDRLRHEAPVYLDPLTGNYVVTRYADVRRILINHRVFSNDAGMVGRSESPVKDIVEKIYLEKGPLPGRNLQTYDPPEHKIHRAPVDGAFNHWNVMALRDFMVEQANLFIDEFIDAGEVEFVSAFAIKFPLRIFADQLGVAYDDAPMLKLWADVAVEEINPVLTPEREIEIAHILADMNAYYQRVLAEARAAPDDRLISKLVQMTGPDGEPLDLPELLIVLRAIVVAAGDTTTFAIAGGMKLLMENPEIAEAIRTDPAKLDAFVDEALRIVSPVQTLFRRAREDVEVAGCKIPKGAVIEARYGAANHDPEMFGCPRQIDLNRQNGRVHLAFGVGVHVCPGLQLARAEMQTGFAALLARMCNLRPARGADSFEYSSSYIANGPVKAYIAFDRR